MHWKTKTRIQNAVELCPTSISYGAYYWLQRRFGGLRRINPERKLEAAVKTWELIRDLGKDPVDRVFLEVGTGRIPNVPMAFWLMGAKRTVTIDINPYMKSELVVEALEYIAQNRNKVRDIFGALLNEGRFNELLSLDRGKSFSLDSFLDMCHITYVAPGDAAATGLAENSVDFHTSRTVLEHIPRPVLEAILKEGSRIVRRDGLFVHRIDYSDHFSHSDKSISSINFLQYSDAEWDRYVQNRYMYMNRLRHDDFLSLFEAIGHDVLLASPDVDARALELLSTGSFELDERFQQKSTNVLSISGSWIVSKSDVTV